MKRLLKDSQGMALVVAVFVTAILMTLTGASLLFSQLNLKITSNHKLGTQGLELADGGVQHALGVVPVGVDFDILLNTTVVNTTSFSSLPDFSFTVTVENDPGDSGGPPNDTNGTAVLVSSASGPANSRKVVKAYIRRAIPRGAIYVPGEADKIETHLESADAIVNGNDTNLNNSPGPQSPVPAIATTSDATSAEISPAYPELFTGMGPTPSIMTTVKIDVNALASAFMSLPHATLAWGGSGGSFNTVANVPEGSMGTLATPQITVITGNVHFSGKPPQPNCAPPDSANCTGKNFGAGVLIVQGDLILSGNFTFAGLVIVLGGTLSANPHVDMSGNSYIHGMLMSKESTVTDGSSYRELKMSGNATVKYSSQAIEMVNNKWYKAVPTKLIGWKEDF